MAKFDSYRKPLERVLMCIGEKTETPLIVEYGPGGSTKLMKEILPGARIISVEHNRTWYLRYQEEFSRREYEGVQLMLKKTSNGYVQAPDDLVNGEKAMLVYIDGRRRSACLRHAAGIVDHERGFIVLHDAERIGYWPALANIPNKKRLWAGTMFSKTLIIPSDVKDLRRLSSGIPEARVRN